jgi:hypothetical protein
MGSVTRISFPLWFTLRGLEADSLEELFEGCGNAPIESVETSQPVIREPGLSGDGSQQPSRERSVDAFEHLEDAV